MYPRLVDEDVSFGSAEREEVFGSSNYIFC